MLLLIAKHFIGLCIIITVCAFVGTNAADLLITYVIEPLL